jgi:glutaredoxin 3
VSAQVVIYTTGYCPYCTRAKSLLSKKSVQFQEVDVSDRPDLRSWIAERTGQRTVPQVFVNGEPLGGFTDIAALEQRGLLDPKLSREPSAADPALRF